MLYFRQGLDTWLTNIRHIKKLEGLIIFYERPFIMDELNRLPAATLPIWSGPWYVKPANCCCTLSESLDPSTIESTGASDVNSSSKFDVSIADDCGRKC